MTNSQGIQYRVENGKLLNKETGKAIPDSLPVVMHIDDTIYLFGDGSSVRLGEDGKLSNALQPDESVTSVSIADFNDDKVFTIKTKDDPEKSTLGFTLDVFSNGVGRVRTPNPHDGIDDVNIMGEEQVNQMLWDLVKLDVPFTSSQLNAIEKPETPSLKARLFGRP